MYTVDALVAWQPVDLLGCAQASAAASGDAGDPAVVAIARTLRVLAADDAARRLHPHGAGQGASGAGGADPPRAAQLGTGAADDGRLQVGLLLSGVVVVEDIFAFPGLGLYTVRSIQTFDLRRSPE